MTPIEKFLLFVAAPTVLALSVLEAVVLTVRGGYDWRAFGVSMFDYVLRIVITIAVPFSIVQPLVPWVESHRLTVIAVDSVAAALLLFITLEFFYYWLHRAGHRVRWFWNNHAVHHTPNQLNLGASLRIGAFGRAAGVGIFLLPMVWMGFDQRLLLAALTLNLLYQFWIHATWIPKLGWLEGWLNTPSAHRVHHAANLEYLDGNYGGVLLIFDRLFGTYIPERDDLPCRYGLVKPMTSYNRWWLSLRSGAGCCGTWLVRAACAQFWATCSCRPVGHRRALAPPPKNCAPRRAWAATALPRHRRETSPWPADLARFCQTAPAPWSRGAAVQP